MPRFTHSKRNEMYYDQDDDRDIDDKEELSSNIGTNSHIGKLHSPAVQCEVYDGEDFVYGVNCRHRKAIGNNKTGKEEDLTHKGKTSYRTRRNRIGISSGTFREILDGFKARKDA